MKCEDATHDVANLRKNWQIWKNGRNFYSCNLQVWLLYSYSKTIASPVNFTGKIFIKLTPGENEKCGEICTGVGEYTQMSICTPCKVANSTKIANLTEICHGFGEYMTIDEKKGDERLCQFTIFVKIATFQGPLLPSHFTFCQTFREISPNSICLLFCCCWAYPRCGLEFLERFNLRVDQEGKTIIPS